MIDYEQFTNEILKINIGGIADTKLFNFTADEFNKNSNKFFYFGCNEYRSENQLNNVVASAKFVLNKELYAFEIIEKLEKSSLLNFFYFKSFVDNEELKFRHFIKLQCYKGEKKIAKIYPFNNNLNFISEISKISDIKLRKEFNSIITNIDVDNIISFYGSTLIFE